MSSRFVLVVEDDVLLRELLSTALEAHGYIVQSAGTASDARRLIQNGDLDGAVLDVDLGVGPNGFDLAQNLRARFPSIGLVFLTQLPDSRFAVGTDKVPSDIAYLNKSALTDLGVLFEALDHAMQGAITKRNKKFRHDENPERPLAKLTRKQIEVLQLMSQGKTNAQIAAHRGTSITAVEDTIRRACEALGVSSSTGVNQRAATVATFLAVVGTHKGILEE